MYGILQTAFRPSCMNRASVFKWLKRFKEGRESVRDDERCERNYCLHVPWRQIPKENQCIELWRTISRKKAFHLKTSSHVLQMAPRSWLIATVIAKLFEKAVPKVLTVHCVIHRQHLMAKNLSEWLHESLSTVITAVNKIKANALNSRLFHKPCIENDEDF